VRALRQTWPLLVVLATGCVSSKPNYTFMPAAAWSQELIRRGVDVREVPNPLAVGEPIHQMAEEFAGIGTPVERMQRLQRAFFDEKNFPFRYANRGTFTAAEAFARREGNCLSFTNLFVAMGRSIGIPITTALVTRTQASEREGDLIIVNNHVVAALPYGTEWQYFDFDRRPHDRPKFYLPLDDLWITALYLNNRGADELRLGHPDIALRRFEDATKLAPRFAASWGNVGVARRRLGDVQGAFDAYAQALAISADDPTILGNLASLYRSIGKESEAQMALKAVNVSHATPHVLIVRGDLELAQGRTKGAIRLYKRARALSPKLADPWVALARADLARSRPESARKDLEKALTLEPGHLEASSLLVVLKRRQASATPR
jgi:tetratricopeptide (TPR) repeat protein